MSLAVDYTMGDVAIRAKNHYINSAPVTTSSTASVDNDSLFSEKTDAIFGEVGSGNTCTDGKDDGKIGIFGVIGNVLQGAVRSIPNMIKGAFTGSDGKFSIIKTATTLATGALCIAFPAVGLAACAVGAATGVVKMGSNVVTALNADTDAEAKAAWEQVGSGAVTTGLSVAGAKASYGAMTKTSTAGALDGLSGEGFISKVKENGVIETAKALGKDAVSSTKNSASKLWSKVKQFDTNRKLKSEAREYNKNAEKIENLSNKEGELTEAEKTTLENLQKKQAETPENVVEKSTELKNDANARSDAATQNKNTRTEIKKGKEKLTELKESLSKAEEADKAAIEKQISDTQKYIDDLNKNTTFGKLTSSVKDKGGEYTQNTQSALKGISDSASGLTKFKAFRAKISPTNLPKIASALGKDGMAIAKALMNKSISEEALIGQFGYEKVGQVLEVLAAAENTDQNI